MTEIPGDMSAAFIRRTGAADEIEIGRWPVPECGPDEVLVQVEALAVNHVDTLIRSGAYKTPLPLPFIIGRDFVGRVAAAGKRAGPMNPGDRVWCNSLGYAGRQGAFADFAHAPADRVYPLPPGLDPVEAVSVVHPAATAWLGLFREGGLAAGETVFVGGAAGAVGGAAVQLAAAAGARVFASASMDDADWVKARGADRVFDYHDPALFARIARAAPQGIDLYWDSSGHHDLDRTLAVLGQGGRIIISAGLRARVGVPIGALYTRDASVRGFALSNASVEQLAEAAEAINRHLADGDLQARIGRRIPLRDAAEAHRLQQASGSERVRGRIVVVADEWRADSRSPAVSPHGDIPSS